MSFLGMMANKDHNEYMSYFKDVKTLTTIDIPNQPNSIKGKELKDKLNSFKNINYKESVEEAIKSIPVKENDIILNYWISLSCWGSIEFKLDIFI